MAQTLPPRTRPLPVLLALLCLLAAGAVVFRAGHRPPAPPPVVPHYTPQQAATAQQHLDALRDQVLGPPAAEPSPPPPSPSSGSPHVIPSIIPPPQSEPVRLALSQADLNAYLATNHEAQAQLRARGIRAVQVLLRRPRNVIFRASVLYRGRPADFQIAGALRPSPRTLLRLEATSAQIGSLPLPPKFVTAQADKIAAQLTRPFQGRLPLAVDGVQVVGDQLVLTGTRRRPG